MYDDFIANRYAITADQAKEKYYLVLPNLRICILCKSKQKWIKLIRKEQKSI